MTQRPAPKILKQPTNGWTRRLAVKKAKATKAQKRHRARAQSRICNLKSLRHPIPNKNIGLVRRLGVAIRGPHQLLPIRREHGEAVEAIAVGDPLQAVPSGFISPQFKFPIAADGVGLRIVVRREDDFLAVGSERRTKARRAEIRDLLLVAIRRPS